MKHEVKLQPLRVPSFVLQVVPAGRRQDGFREAPKYRLGELSDTELEALCEQFRKAVFEKAAKDRQAAAGGLTHDR